MWNEAAEELKEEEEREVMAPPMGQEVQSIAYRWRLRGVKVGGEGGGVSVLSLCCPPPVWWAQIAIGA